MGEFQRLGKSRISKSRSAAAGGGEHAAPVIAGAAPAPAWASGPVGAPLALGGGAVQRKVAIGPSNDAYERQADHVASRVAGGGAIAPGSISPIAPAAVTSLGQRQGKPEEKKKNEKPAPPPVQRQAKPEEKKKDEKPAAPVQRELKPEDTKKDPKAAAAQVQRQAKPEEKKKEDKTPPPIQRQAKPEEKKKEEKPAPPPVQRQAKPAEKKKDEKPAPPPVQRQAGERKKDEKPAPVQRQGKPEEKKKEEKPAPPTVQRQATPDAKKKDEKPAPPPVQRQAKPEEKKKDEKPIPPPVQRAVRPEDKKKEEVPGTLSPQRAAAEEIPKDEEGSVQASPAGGGAASAPSMASAASHAIATKGPGEPLNSATRSVLESRMGTDLSDVRVHSDGAAHETASALNARAFTHQNDIWLGRGESQHNTQLMAHEAAHVLQQTGSVHRILVQRADGKAETPKDTPAGATGDPKTGLLDPTAKTITFEQIEIPAFKTEAHRGVKYSQHSPLTRQRDYKRGNPNQRDEWRDNVNAAEIKNKLIEKAQPVREGVPAGAEYVFKVPTSAGGKPFFIGKIDDIAKDLTIPYWGGKSKRPEAKLFDVDHIVELQLAFWNKEKWANKVDNMELLEMSANRSSGSLIANAVDKKVDEFLSAGGSQKTVDAKEPKEPKKGSKKQDKSAREQIKRDYDLVFQKATGVGGPSVGPTSFWTQTQIERTDHLEPVVASSLDEIRGKGTVLVFSRASGGLGKSFLWKESDKAPKAPEGNESEWLKPFTIKQKSFITSDGSEKTSDLGSLTIYIPDNDKKWKQYPEEEIKIRRIPGARYAGYLNKNEVKSKAEKIEKKGTSPLQVNEFDILEEGGLHVTGQILPDIPLIKDIGLEFEVRGNDLRIFKVFRAGDFQVPKPLVVTDSALTLSFSTETGFRIDGQVNFGIERVGEGYLKAGIGGGFNLAGGFSFDSSLFDPAQVDMKYEANELTIEGHLGIKEGKVRGLKSADLTVSYQAGTIKAAGSVKPNIPAVEQGDFSLTYSEKEGLLIAGDLQLKKDIPGIAGGSIHAEVAKKPGSDRYIVKASGEATPKIPGISAKLSVAYDDGAFDIVGTAGYEKGMLKGSVTVGATNRPVGEDGKPAGPPPEGSSKITLYGGGSVTLKLAPWLQATAAIKFKPNGEVEVTGEIGLPSTLDIFDEKKVDKNLFKVGVDIPIVGVSVLGKRIGIFLNITGGLDLSAGIGPGQLRDVKLSVTYNPAHEEETKVHGHAALHIPAHAGLRLFVQAAIGAGILIVSARGGIELGGQLGIEGAAHAEVDVDWTPKKGLVLDAKAEVSAEPKFKFDISGFVLVEADLLLKTVNLYEKHWQLAAVEYGSGLKLGLKLPIHYEEGKPFSLSLSDIQFEVPNVDATEVLKGLIKKIA